MQVQVLVAGSTVPAWQAACIAHLRAVAGLTVSVAAGTGPFQAPGRLAARLGGAAVAATPVAFDAAADEPDVVLDLTGSASAPAGGEVWRYRVGDGCTSGLPFARETARGAESADVALVRHAGGADAVLRAGRFPITRWYPSTLRWALMGAAKWPAILLAAQAGGTALDASPRAFAAPGPPLRFAECVRFGIALLRRLAGHVTASLFQTTEWNVGFSRASAAALLDGAPLTVRWLPRPRAGSFVADPFVVERDGRRVVFVEDYDEVRARGVIAALELDEADAIVRRATVIDTGSHLSYPSTLEVDGVLYLVPESSAAREAALYRCADFPWKWEREGAIFPQFDALDTTLFAHAGLWWALCTRASRGSDFALYAFYAASPRGPWQAHARNPVIEDVTCGRPGGAPFVVAGALFRPGQNCARSYGGGLTIARIDELSPHAYRETVVRRIDARNFGRYADGVHTVGVISGGLVLDGKRAGYDLARPLRRFLRSRRG